MRGPWKLLPRSPAGGEPCGGCPMARAWCHQGTGSSTEITQPKLPDHIKRVRLVPSDHRLLAATRLSVCPRGCTHSHGKTTAVPNRRHGGLGDDTGRKRRRISASPDISAQDEALRHTASPAMLLWRFHEGQNPTMCSAAVVVSPSSQARYQSAH